MYEEKGMEGKVLMVREWVACVRRQGDDEGFLSRRWVVQLAIWVDCGRRRGRMLRDAYAEVGP